jgi:hypothetical protein
MRVGTRRIRWSRPVGIHGDTPSSVRRANVEPSWLVISSSRPVARTLQPLLVERSKPSISKHAGARPAAESFVPSPVRKTTLSPSMT